MLRGSGSRSNNFLCNRSRLVLDDSVTLQTYRKYTLLLLLLSTLTSGTCQGFCTPDLNGIVNLSGQLADIKMTSRTFIACQNDIDNITSLDLSNNKINSIEEDTFSTFYNLKLLDLSHNRLNSISKRSFLGLHNLKELNLAYNRLERLEAGTFDLMNLETIHVNHNNITEVEPGTVNIYNVNLRNFNISHNSLTYLDPWPYLTYQSYTRTLSRDFDIRYNQITALTNFMNWTYDLKYDYEVHVYAQFNKIETASLDMLRQYDPHTSDNSLFPTLLTYLNITNNDFICDCRTYDLANAVRGSLLRYLRVDDFRYRCESPAHLKGSDFLHDTPLHFLVCNHTSRCPTNCFCQERPYDGILFVNCTNAGLSALPKELPETRTPLKIELHLDHNEIQHLENRAYLPFVNILSVANNHIEYLDPTVLGDLKETTHINVSSNRLTTIPKNVQKFDSIKLSGNPLRCHCKSLWIRKWMEVGVNNADTELKCTFGKNNKSIVILSVTERSLGCTNDLQIILGSIFGCILIVVIVVVILTFRCPFEAKVCLHKCLSVHIWDNPSVDRALYKDIDIYLVFDELDKDVMGYIPYFERDLQTQTPLYAILNPQRFTRNLPIHDGIFKDIGRSKRVIVFLSKRIFENEIRKFEIDDAEHRQIEEILTHGKTDTFTHNDHRKTTPRYIYLQDVTEKTNGRTTPLDHNDHREATPTDIYLQDVTEKTNGRTTLLDHNDHREATPTDINPQDVDQEQSIGRDYNTDIAPKIIYIIFNHNQYLANRLKKEPWRTRLVGKTVLNPDDKMFWPKLRYELPRTGNGQGDGNHNPFIHCESNVRDIKELHNQTV